MPVNPDIIFILLYFQKKVYRQSGSRPPGRLYSSFFHKISAARRLFFNATTPRFLVILYRAEFWEKSPALRGLTKIYQNGILCPVDKSIFTQSGFGRVAKKESSEKMDENMMKNEWSSFVPGIWQKEINVRDFIQKNYTPYDGDESFLAGPTADTLALWDQVMDLTRQEREKGGVLDMDTRIISTITSHGPGYLDKSKEKIVGFQTDKPFKRSLQPYGGIRMAVKACEDNGYHVDPEIVEFFTKHRKTHNEGVFDAYTPEMRACRSSHIITGLPDAYGRGRIIGDYRRVALYGVDRLIEDKQHQKDTTRTIMYCQRA